MGTSQVPACTVGSLYSQFLFLPVAWVPEELHKLGQPSIPIMEAKDSDKPPNTSQYPGTKNLSAPAWWAAVLSRWGKRKVKL